MRSYIVLNLAGPQQIRRNRGIKKKKRLLLVDDESDITALVIQ
jgi:hypothetical protein